MSIKLTASFKVKLSTEDEKENTHVSFTLFDLKTYSHSVDSIRYALGNHTALTLYSENVE